MRLICLFALLLYVLAARAEQHADIFILHSYSQEYPWTKRQHEGFLDALADDPTEPYAVRVEYLDTKRVPYDPGYARLTRSHLQHKYAGYRPKLVYVTDDNAARFALDHLDSVFPGVPVFFSGVNDKALAQRLDPRRMTGVFEHKEIAPNLALMQGVAGAAHDIVVVGDSSETFEAILRDLKTELQHFPGIRPHILSAGRLDQLVEGVRQQQGRYLFLTTLGALTSREGRVMPLEDSIAALVGTGEYVVFSMEDAYLFPGVLGGYVTSGRQQGRAAAMLVKRYLAGTPMAQLPPRHDSPNEYLIDALELERAGLVLPAEVEMQATLINRRPSFYESNRSVILGSLYALIGMLVLVVSVTLVVVLRKNREIARHSLELISQRGQLQTVQDSLLHAQRIAGMGNWDWSIGDNTLYWSEGIYSLFGIDPEDFEASYEGFLARLHPEDRERVQAAVQRSLEDGEPYDIVHRIIRPDGAIRVVRENGETLRDAGGRPVRMVGVVLDITEQQRIETALREKETHLRQLAHYDQLTGLPNRISLVTALEAAISGARNDSDRLGVMFVDLDRFKPVNDTLGHSIGDRVLQAVATRLRSATPEGADIYRLGGDEFVILLPGSRGCHEAEGAAQQVLDVLQEVFVVAGHRLHLSGSIGIACYPGDGTTAEELLKNADTAMYEAKQEGRNGYQYYRRELTEFVASRLHLEADLRDALSRQHLTFFYQPLVSLETGHVIGAEALLRWVDDSGRMVPPDHFIPLAEETGLILPIGDWGLEAACLALGRWQDEGLLSDGFSLNINVSGKQLQQDGYAARLEAELNRQGIAPQRLVLELTESTIMSGSRQTINTLQALRAVGIEIAIDDFGTGFSSLAHLKQLPIGEIKIDRSFVTDIPRDPNDEAIVVAVIALANSLDLHVVAEGVETEAQEIFLREQGCHYAQGYRYSRPLPEAEFLQLLRQGGSLMGAAEATG